MSHGDSFNFFLRFGANPSKTLLSLLVLLVLLNISFVWCFQTHHVIVFSFYLFCKYFCPIFHISSFLFVSLSIIFFIPHLFQWTVVKNDKAI